MESLFTTLASHSGRRGAALRRITLAALLLAPLYESALGADDDLEIRPAPPSIGADVPVTYFGPQPALVQRELVGEYQLLKSGKVDLEKATITLPLYDGRMRDGRAVWYVVTDTDDRGNAEQLGLNYSPKLTYADVGRAVRKASLVEKFKLVFDSGTVDFKPQRSATPGDAPNFLMRSWMANPIGCTSTSYRISYADRAVGSHSIPQSIASET